MTSTDRTTSRSPSVIGRPIDSLNRWWRRGLNRLRSRGRPAVSRAMRMTGATVAAYVVALILLPGTVPVIAALTALLFVEVTLFDIVTSGVQRVVSVVAGVLLAVSSRRADTACMATVFHCARSCVACDGARHAHGARWRA